MTSRLIAAHVELAMHVLADRLGTTPEHLARIGIAEVLQEFGESIAPAHKAHSAHSVSGVWCASSDPAHEWDDATPVKVEPMLERMTR
jgi:hypothetical protein